MKSRLSTIATVTALVSAAAAPAFGQARHGGGAAHGGAAHGGAAHGGAAHGGAARGRGRGHGNTAAPATPAVDPAVAQARAEYDQGRQLAETNPTEALTHFRHAYELRPTAVILLPIAQLEEQLGHVPEAIDALDRYLRDPATQTAANRAETEQRLAVLRARPATLHITSTPTGAGITLDGTETGQNTPADVPAPAGHHTVLIEHPGYTAFSREIDATPGARAEISAEMAALPAPAEPVVAQPATSTGMEQSQPVVAVPTQPPPESGGVNPAVIISGALAVAGLGAGTVFGFMALSDKQDYDAMPTQATRERGETNALLSDVFFGVTILSAAVAIVVWATDSNPHAESTPAATVTASRHRRHRGPEFHAAPTGLLVTF